MHCDSNVNLLSLYLYTTCLHLYTSSAVKGLNSAPNAEAPKPEVPKSEAECGKEVLGDGIEWLRLQHKPLRSMVECSTSSGSSSSTSSRSTSNGAGGGDVPSAV